MKIHSLFLAALLVVALSAASYADSLTVTATRDCEQLFIEASFADTTSRGIDRIMLRANAENTRVTFIEPADGVVGGMRHTRFIVEPVDTLQSAKATVVIADRYANSTEIPYRYTPYRLEIAEGEPVVIEVDSIGENIIVPGTVTFTNRSGGTFNLESMELEGDGGLFEIRDPGQFVPGKSVLPGETYSIGIAYHSVAFNGADTVELVLDVRFGDGCVDEFRILIVARRGVTGVEPAWYGELDLSDVRRSATDDAASVSNR